MDDRTALQLTGLKLKLAETIAVRAAAEASLPQRELFLQRQLHAMVADGRAAGMKAPDAEKAADRVIDWVRSLVERIEARKPDPVSH